MYSIKSQFSVSKTRIILSELAKIGPQTQHKLYEHLQKECPNEFKSVSRHKFKVQFMASLKKFNLVQVKPIKDADIIEEMAKDPETRVKEGQKEAWVVRLTSSATDTASSNTINYTDEEKSKLIKALEDGAMNNKDFWKGSANAPFDWKALLKNGKVDEQNSPQN
ncbi:hypothetical protein LPJ78_001896 [Coemansia sp. RSA 989]|nr:hypothetical protein LPJ68_003128 [Coemansia sp. RSA 1086]KAJ1751650.1 hypothetical protein LPJ79_001919 [Coemansia sp. RSA 1821]KAJ1866325.1 hypothetical protein LPJ78_001896 [Coemansia sp. RSA 989]KAJ1873744.1 hypothetical protein LPJ55_002083 [Coemansia sp. RSA 990]KAJ2632614.1 hypothetical protein H4R22_001118 [Coemansia sp. RSA 1290]KAJ2653909.1 hypothetical protein IWW40_000193 [Coemansia sp. RSA 1250]KAJ2677059.1 hypothetical protein IWW42_000397 [Coemansia sp. RSA 1085]